MRSLLNLPVPMANTLKLLAATPPFKGDEKGMPPKEWEQMWKPVLESATAEVWELIKMTQAATPYPLLKGVQLRPMSWGTACYPLGNVEILPDDVYLKKSGDLTIAEEKKTGRHDTARRLMIEFALIRAKAMPDFRAPSEIGVTLRISSGPEMTALVDLVHNWRGIFGLVLEGLPITVMGNTVSVSATIKDPLRILDAIVADPGIAGDDFDCRVDFTCRQETPPQTIARSFQALAILFTCIQLATHQPRSQKRHLLDAWMKLGASRHETSSHRRPKS